MSSVSAVAARRVFRPIVLTVVAMVAALDVLLVGGLEVLSAARTLAANRCGRKAQKESVAALRRYAETRDPSDYARYERAIAVPPGDHRARLVLDQPLQTPRTRSTRELAPGASS